MSLRRGEKIESLDQLQIGMLVKIVSMKYSIDYTLDRVYAISDINSSNFRAIDSESGWRGNYLVLENVVFWGDDNTLVEVFPEKTEVRPRVFLQHPQLKLLQNWQADKLELMASTWNKNIYIVVRATLEEQTMINDPDGIVIVSRYCGAIFNEHKTSLARSDFYDYYTILEGVSNDRVFFTHGNISGSIVWLGRDLFSSAGKKLGRSNRQDEKLRKVLWNNLCNVLISKYGEINKDGNLTNNNNNNKTIFLAAVTAEIKKTEKRQLKALEDYEREIKSYQDSIRSIILSANKVRSQTNQVSDQLKKLTDQTDSLSDEILKIPEVSIAQQRFEKDAFCLYVKTKPLMIDFPSTVLPIGTFEFLFKIKSSFEVELKIIGAHPHNKSGVRYCFGGFNLAFVKATSELDLFNAVNICIAMLKTYNIGSELVQLTSIMESYSIIIDNMDFMKKIDENEEVEVLVFD